MTKPRIVTVIQGPARVDAPAGQSPPAPVRRAAARPLGRSGAGGQTDRDGGCGTTTNPEDQALVSLMEARGVYVFRGHPSDLLDRHVRAARAFGAKSWPRSRPIGPLISPSIIDRVFGAFPRRPRIGLCFQSPSGQLSRRQTTSRSCPSPPWRRLWREAARPFEREHTTPFLWDNPDRFRIGNAAWERGLDYSMSHRWTIDYEDDYRFIRTVYNALFPRHPLFGLEEILTLLRSGPGWPI